MGIHSDTPLLRERSERRVRFVAAGFLLGWLAHLVAQLAVRP